MIKFHPGIFSPVFAITLGRDQRTFPHIVESIHEGIVTSVYTWSSLQNVLDGREASNGESVYL